MRRLKNGSLLGACFAAAACGQAGPLSFESDPAEYYGSRFFLTILLLGAVLVLYSLIRYRGRVEGTISWTLLIAGVLVVPSISTTRESRRRE